MRVTLQDTLAGGTFWLQGHHTNHWGLSCLQNQESQGKLQLVYMGAWMCVHRVKYWIAYPFSD